MNATNAREKMNLTMPEPDKGVLKREPAICSDCHIKCVIKGNGKVNDGFYTYYDDKLCKRCAKRQGIV